MKTLPDILRADLAILSIGLNPSLPSVRYGYYFANPRNRFWRALQGAEMLPCTFQPGLDAQAYLFSRGLGFTDVVKRPTSMGAQLRARDYRVGACELELKLRCFAPAFAWFHGKVAYKQFLKMTARNMGEVDWGLQDLTVGKCRVYLSPNPSPANAAYSLALLIDSYAALKELACF